VERRTVKSPMKESVKRERSNPGFRAVCRLNNERCSKTIGKRGRASLTREVERISRSRCSKKEPIYTPASIEDYYQIAEAVKGASWPGGEYSLEWKRPGTRAGFWCTVDWGVGGESKIDRSPIYS